MIDGKLPLLNNQSDVLMQIVSKYQEWKIFIAQWVGISDWELHTQTGMLVFLLVAILLRKPLRSAWPVMSIIVVEAMNEGFDRLAYGDWRWPDTIRDALFTLLWPILIYIFTRSGFIERD
jgi:hypothetical protein